jgi:hypothetical protein
LLDQPRAIVGRSYVPGNCEGPAARCFYLSLQRIQAILTPGIDDNASSATRKPPCGLGANSSRRASYDYYLSFESWHVNLPYAASPLNFIDG